MQMLTNMSAYPLNASKITRINLKPRDWLKRSHQDALLHIQNGRLNSPQSGVARARSQIN
jgi:hypothetical protein